MDFFKNQKSEMLYSLKLQLFYDAITKFWAMITNHLTRKYRFKQQNLNRFKRLRVIEEYP